MGGKIGFHFGVPFHSWTRERAWDMTGYLFDGFFICTA